MGPAAATRAREQGVHQAHHADGARGAQSDAYHEDRCCGAARLHCGRNAARKTPSKMSLQLDGIDGPVDWPVTPGDDVNEQLRVLFSGREMKDGDSIVFAPGTYHLNSTVILYGHDAESQILRNITLRGTPGDVLICADEASRLDHLFFVCRDPECYQGPEHRVIHFSGLNFRNGHLMRGRNAIVCALGGVDVVMEDCRVLKSRDAREGKSRSQNMLGKFKQPLFPGVSYAWLEGGWEACVADY